MGTYVYALAGNKKNFVVDGKKVPVYLLRFVSRSSDWSKPDYAWDGDIAATTNYGYTELKTFRDKLIRNREKANEVACVAKYAYIADSFKKVGTLIKLEDNFDGIWIDTDPHPGEIIETV